MFTNSVKSRLLLGAAVSALMLGSAVTTATAEDYTTGTIAGTIQDEAGTVLSGATIVIKSNKGVTRTVTSNEKGHFRLPALPVGQYIATITKDGYAVLTDQTVNVSIGASGDVTFTMDSMDTNIEEIFVVGTRRAGYDFNSTTSGMTVDVDDVFNRTPIARNAESVALLAPGSSEGDSRFGGGDNVELVSIGGSGVAENAYYVNGMNVTNFNTMEGGSTIPFEFYDIIEVKTGGYQAEFGRSLGGVFNAVTKSGSNEFHGGANIFWEGNSLRGKKPRTYSNGRSSNLTYFDELNTRERMEYNFHLSGPIIEDRFFFYGIINPRHGTDVTYDQSTKRIYKKDDPFWGVKFDLNLFEGHHLEATLFDDGQSRTVDRYRFQGTTQPTDGSTPVPLAEGAVDDNATGEYLGRLSEDRGGINKIFKYSGAFTDWLTVSALYGVNKYNRTDDVGESKNFPSIIDANGNQIGSAVAADFTTANDKREAFRFDADIYFDLMGEHHVRMGFDRENLTADALTERSGGKAYTYALITGDETNLNLINIADRITDGSISVGDEFVQISEYRNGGAFKTIQSAWYIQDSWSVTDNLTLNLGIRNETFENKDSNGATFIKTTNQLAPRLGFTWDPTGDGIHRVYGNWGRYHLPMATNTSIRQASAEYYVTDSYLIDGKNTDKTPDIDFTDEANHLARNVTGDGTLNDPRTLVDLNVKPMYQDEWILGYDHDFENGWVAGIRGVYRKLGSLMEDIAIDRAVNKWALENGYGDVSDIWSGFHQYIITNPGNDVRVGTVDLPGENGELVYMDFKGSEMGYPKGKRTYKAIELTFAREWDGDWSLQGSYTLSWSKGNYEGSVKSDTGQNDAGITTDFDQPDLTDGADGYLPNDRRHNFKIWGAYQVMENVQVNAKFALQSGRKYGCMGPTPQLNADGDINFGSYYGSYGWYCDNNGDGKDLGDLVGRGTVGDTGWIKTLDFGVAFTPTLNGAVPGNIMIRADVFNVFDSHQTTMVVERGELSSGAKNKDYRKPYSYQTPRTVRLSASYKF